MHHVLVTCLRQILKSDEQKWQTCLARRTSRKVINNECSIVSFKQNERETYWNAWGASPRSSTSCSQHLRRFDMTSFRAYHQPNRESDPDSKYYNCFVLALHLISHLQKFFQYVIPHHGRRSIPSSTNDCYFHCHLKAEERSCRHAPNDSCCWHEPDLHKTVCRTLEGFVLGKQFLYIYLPTDRASSHWRTEKGALHREQRVSPQRARLLTADLRHTCYEKRPRVLCSKPANCLRLFDPST